MLLNYRSAKDTTYRHAIKFSITNVKQKMPNKTKRKKYIKKISTRQDSLTISQKSKTSEPFSLFPLVDPFFNSPSSTFCRFFVGKIRSQSRTCKRFLYNFSVFLKENFQVNFFTLL